MYRQRRRPCPGCGGPMEEIPLDGSAGPATVDRCPHCLGVLFDFFDGEPAELCRLLESGDAPCRDAGDAPHAPSCPDCGLAMSLHHYQDRGPVLARCGRCLAAFVTRDQLSELAAFAFEEQPTGFWRRIHRALFESE